MAATLEALASPVRLTLLRELRTPKTLTEIDLRLEDPTRPDAPPRPLARQTVREHLDRLLAIGAVIPRETVRNRGPTLEYLLNHQAFYAMAEEFRELASLRPVAEPRRATVAFEGARPDARFSGPSLVLVKGADEGRVFPLESPAGARRQWTIGRSRGSQVALDFDPYVSAENSLITWEGGVHFLEDLPESRNGSLLNFEPIPKGERRALHAGDLVGVGRSVLSFRAA